MGRGKQENHEGCVCVHVCLCVCGEYVSSHSEVVVSGKECLESAGSRWDSGKRWQRDA